MKAGDVSRWQRARCHPKATASPPARVNFRGREKASTITIIIFKSTFVPKLQPSPRTPIQLSKIPVAVLQAIQLHATHKPSPYTPTDNNLPSTIITNNVPSCKIPTSSTKNRVEQPTATSIVKPRFFSTSHQFPNLQNYTHYHWRLQPNLQKQEAKMRALFPS
jgi:hypothetical protein